MYSKEKPYKMPTKAGNALKLLRVNAGETDYEWATAGGAFAGDMDDIPDGTTYVKTENNYTDADAAKVAATSGTNTGDNATNTLYSGLAASKLDATAFVGLAKITVGTSTPGSPSVGDLWIDTN
jgi:hypothetical protein